MQTITMNTPIGQVPVPEWATQKLLEMTDMEVCNKCFEMRCIDPFALAELERRRLIFKGDYEMDVRVRVATKEAEKLSTVHALAKPLRIGHTSSGTFRIWYKGYFGKTEEQIQYKYTTWGSYDEAMLLVNMASGVRVDRYDSEHGWATIWLTSVEYLALQPFEQ